MGVDWTKSLEKYQRELEECRRDPVVHSERMVTLDLTINLMAHMVFIDERRRREAENRMREERRELQGLMAQLRCAEERNCLSQPETRGDEWFFAGVRVVARAATGLWQK